jgi:hypothetical protein
MLSRFPNSFIAELNTLSSLALGLEAIGSNNVARCSRQRIRVCVSLANTRSFGIWGTIPCRLIAVLGLASPARDQLDRS